MLRAKFLPKETDARKVTFSLANAAEDTCKWGPNEGQEGILGGDLIPGFSLYRGAKMDGTGPTSTAQLPLHLNRLSPSPKLDTT